MLLKFGTPVRSRGERLGTLWGLTVEPSERLLLRLIVEEPQAEPLVRRKVPFGRLVQADSDQVVLNLSPAEFADSPTHDLEGLRDERSSGGSRRRRGDEPPERLLTSSARLLCRDGEVGRLLAVGIDARTGDIESVSFPFGVPVTREIVIGGENVEELRDERVSLRIPMQALSEFPSRHSV